VAYNTRVEKVEKRFNEHGEEAGWTLTLKEVASTGKHSSRARWTKEVRVEVLLLDFTHHFLGL
jgi:hypothetical protein